MHQRETLSTARTHWTCRLLFGLLTLASTLPALGQDRSLSPEVIYTGAPPTGYAVTFRYHAPQADLVQIQGEWSFSLPEGAQGFGPADWQPGAFPAGNWPVVNMTRGGNGYWTYSTPLPSGTFTYQFYVDDPDNTRPLPDPSNPPWNPRDGETIGSVNGTSQVYVPADPNFETLNYWWQRPRSQGPSGELVNLVYSSPTHWTPAGQNRVAVYTPPGYDPDRAEPYPVLYLSHGAGGNEMDWSTQGVAGHILDNLIVTGQIEPIVAVMINFQGFAIPYPDAGWENPVVEDLVNRLMPFIAGRYNVSTQSSNRAFAGLSAGGSLAHRILLDHSRYFGYFGFFSPGGGTLLTDLTDQQREDFASIGFFVGGGFEEPTEYRGNPGPRTNAVNDAAILSAARLSVATSFIHGTHSWYVWRIMLRDFLTRTAFLPVSPG